MDVVSIGAIRGERLRGNVTLGPLPDERICTRRKLDLDAIMRDLALMNTGAWHTTSLSRHPSTGAANQRFVAFQHSRRDTTVLRADTLFELYAWMLSSMKAVGPSVRGQWGWHSAFNMVEAHGCTDLDRHCRGDGFSWAWREQLRDRMLLALLSDGLVGKWREVAGLTLLPSVWINALVHDASNVDDDLDALFALSDGRRTRYQLNTSHADAIHVVGVSLYAPNTWQGHKSWIVQMQYGVDGSVWDEDYRPMNSGRRPKSLRPAQQKGESFLTFVRRARLELEKLLVPATGGEGTI